MSEAKVEGKEERRGGKKSIAYDRKEISTRVFRRIRSLENTSYEKKKKKKKEKKTFEYIISPSNKEITGDLSV